MLEADGLECVRGDRKLFSAVGFELPEGSVLHVRGKNGAGKSSLLRMLCGFIKPERGEIRWAGKKIGSAEYHRALCYIGHHNGIKDDLSAAENLRINCGLSGQEVGDKQVSEALKKMGLKGREHLPAKVLSQGQKRRVALARLLLTDATLWILDEPVAALDVHAVEFVESLLARHVEAGGMLVLTTHQEIRVEPSRVREVWL